MSARYLRAALRLSLFIFLPLSLAPSSCEARVWTNDQGQTIEAEFVRVSGRMAMLKQGDKTVKAPIARLSDTDQDWIKRFKKIDKVREWGPDAVRGRYDKLSDSEVRVRFGGDSAKIPISDLTDEDIAHLVERYGMLEQELPAEIAARRPEGAPALEGSSAPRDWTDLNGRTITAQFVRLEGNAVVIFRKGREFKVPLSKLSEEDQLWAASQAASANQFAREIQPTNTQPYDLAGPPDEGRGDRLPNNQQSAMQQAMAEQSKQIAFGVLGTVFRTVKYRDDREGYNSESQQSANQSAGHWSNRVTPPTREQPQFTHTPGTRSPAKEPPPVSKFDSTIIPLQSSPDSQSVVANEGPSVDLSTAKVLPPINDISTISDEQYYERLEAVFGKSRFNRYDELISYGGNKIVGYVDECEHCYADFEFPASFDDGDPCPFCRQPINEVLTYEEWEAKIEEEYGGSSIFGSRAFRRVIIALVFALIGVVWKFAFSSGD